jgi:diaminopropionate ammonia-lyase
MPYHLNPRARDGCLNPYSPEDYADLSCFYAQHPDLRPTPLRSLPAFARALGLGALHVKDESTRFGLNAFKSLGVRYATDRLQRRGGLPAGATLVCASAGNHGRAVARAARDLGLGARVYMSSAASEAVKRNIASEGADVVVIEGSYDEAVRAMARDAHINGWTIVSDTAWPGYDEIPRWIMLGYTRIVDEIAGVLDGVPDVLFGQGGVGGLVCGLAAGSLWRWGDRRPRLVACEPVGAACLLASARAGRRVTLDFPPTTMMAGLRCAEPSPAAWPAIEALADAFVAIDDDTAAAAMRMLAHPMSTDTAVEAGPSGACGFASLVAVMQDPTLEPVREALRLGPTSRVVVVNTEGATDRELYDRIIGRE